MINDQPFLKFCEGERELHAENARDDDKLLTNMLLLVSTGAFGLSINFFINNTHVVYYPNILKFSWFFLVASIITNSYGYYTARADNEKSVLFFNEKISTNTEIFTSEILNKHIDKVRKSLSRKVMRWLNIFSFHTFIIGIALLAIFSILQIQY